MPKLIHPDTGATVTASDRGAAVLRARGYKDYKGSAPAKKAEPTPPPPEDGTVWPDTHAALDAIAADIEGFEWPEPPEGKKKLTVAEKIAALQAAGYTPGQ